MAQIPVRVSQNPKPNHPKQQRPIQIPATAMALPIVSHPSPIPAGPQMQQVSPILGPQIKFQGPTPVPPGAIAHQNNLQQLLHMQAQAQAAQSQKMRMEAMNAQQQQVQQQQIWMETMAHENAHMQLLHQEHVNEIQKLRNQVGQQAEEETKLHEEIANLKEQLQIALSAEGQHILDQVEINRLTSEKKKEQKRVSDLRMQLGDFEENLKKSENSCLALKEEIRKMQQDREKHELYISELNNIVVQSQHKQKSLSKQLAALEEETEEKVRQCDTEVYQARQETAHYQELIRKLRDESRTLLQRLYQEVGEESRHALDKFASLTMNSDAYLYVQPSFSTPEPKQPQTTPPRDRKSTGRKEPPGFEKHANRKSKDKPKRTQDQQRNPNRRPPNRGRSRGHGRGRGRMQQSRKAAENQNASPV